MLLLFISNTIIIYQREPIRDFFFSATTYEVGSLIIVIIYQHYRHYYQQ